MAHVVPDIEDKQSWEEPCMNCYKQIHYTEDDIINGFINEDCTASGYFIYCPNCGKKMRVSRTNIALC
jgi:uncharacterized protein with PIN domain